MTLFSPGTALLDSSHTEKWKRKTASDKYMKSHFRGRDMAKEPSGDFPFCATRFPLSHGRTGSRNRCRCRVFLSTVHGKFSRKMNLFPLSCMYVHSNAIRYFHLHNFYGRRWSGQREERFSAEHTRATTETHLVLETLSSAYACCQ